MWNVIEREDDKDKPSVSGWKPVWQNKREINGAGKYGSFSLGTHDMVRYWSAYLLDI